jgi:glycerol-3-phosphate dehydrogenase (NAD(P)+)
MARVAVLNAGAWGTALAVSLAGRGHEVTLWARREEQAREIHARCENRTYLPGVTVPETVAVTSELGKALVMPDLVLAVPVSRYMPSLASQIAPLLVAGTPVIHGTKGLDATTLQRPSEILRAALDSSCPVGMLSGPTHAEEVGRGIPTAAVIASEDSSAAAAAQEILNSDRFRVYTNSDLVGVELCAALKNVYAIAAGGIDGLGFGDNAKAALLTRCIAELNRLVVAMGGKSSTVAGLAGLGDLVATCTSRLSRNRRAGEQLGHGATMDQILSSTDQAIEGVFATRAVTQLAERVNVDMPVATEVHAVLYVGKSPLDVISELMGRAATEE